MKTELREQPTGYEGTDDSNDYVANLRAAYLVNSYRVLLTRARQGMVIYIPFGSEIDDTRKPSFYDETHAFLCECGVKELIL